MIGKTLGKYRVIEQIGRGGMAEVYKAYHPGLDRYVAVKLMHSFLASEEGFLERFQREARSVARLRHPNIVQMYDFDAEENVYYMVMEYLKGPSLKNHLSELEAQGKWLPLAEAIHIIRDVGEALDYAHRRDMFHRDVKPANIMLTQDGGAILTDFGIVKMLGGDATQLTATGAMVGTPAYMAPEQSMGGNDDARADIYSLGIVLYQLVTGRLPYEADTPMAVVLKHISAPLPMPTTLNPDLPEGVERVILKALAKDPNDRYQSVREMLAHLDRAMRGLDIPEVDPAITVASQPSGGVPTLVPTPASADLTEVAAPPTRPRRPAWWVFGLIGLAAVALIVVIAMSLGAKDDKAAPTQTPAIVLTTPDTATPRPTDTPRPTNTPDQTATSRAAALDALVLTASAPPPTLTPTSTPTETPTPTSTPDATAIALAACTFDATLVEQNLRTPYLAAGTTFQQTWQLVNSGDCDWPPGTVLALISGEQMGDQDTVEIESFLAPGETADFSVDLRAPDANGSYSAIWQLQREDGAPFGDELPVGINVGPTPTLRPTLPPPPTFTPTPPPTPSGPLEMNSYADLPNCHVNYDAGTWAATLTWQVRGGTGVYEYYYDGPTFERLASSSYDISGQVNRDWSGTFCTRSGGEEICQVFWIYFESLWCK